MSSAWLTTLLRVREYRREVALQSLAQSLQVAKRIRDVSADVEATLARLGHAQQQSSQSGPLDSGRLKQIRQDRDHLRSHREALRGQQASADAAVHHAQANATAKDADAQVLRRLHDRLESEHRQAQRRRDEQSPLEIAVSLCNGRLSD